MLNDPETVAVLKEQVQVRPRRRNVLRKQKHTAALFSAKGVGQARSQNGADIVILCGGEMQT